MPKLRSEPDLEKITINVTKGDPGRLQALYPDLGYSKAIRMIVRAHLRAIEKRTPKAKLELDLTDVELPDNE